MRPYDQTTYGTVDQYVKTGWSNYKGVELMFERRFTHGWGFQAYYMLGNALRAGGTDSAIGYESAIGEVAHITCRGACRSTSTVATGS